MEANGETSDGQQRSDPSSPFKSMSITTETLSLRQSHIGSNFPDSRLMVSEYQKSLRSPQSANRRPLQEFVPYPPDIISTTVERSSSTDWGYQSKTALISHRNVDRNRVDKSEDKHRLRRKLSSESVVSNSGHQEYNGFDKQSVVSLQSNYSNDTNIVAIECADACNQTEDVVKINEYIQVSITDDNTGPLFDLRRKLALERGKSEQLDKIMEDMVKERSDLQMRLHSMDKEIKVKDQKIDELNSQRERHLSECEELKLGINKWETIVSEYQEFVDAKTVEIQALNEDIAKLNERNESIKINWEHSKIDLESKENTIKELNKKISQTNIEIDSLIQNKVGLEEEIKRTRAEIGDTVGQKEWTELELNKVRVQLNETHQKLVTEQQLSITARNESERVQTLNSLLKQELIEVKHKAVKEKENLMRHLEGIGAQIVQKESELQLLSPKNEQIVGRNDITDDLRQRLHQKDIEIENLNRELTKICETNKRLVNENNLSANNVNSLKRLNSDKDHEIQSLKSYNSDLELKIRGINIDLNRQKELIEILRKDKKDSDSKLNSLVIENKTLDSATKQMKETIEKHERSLKQMQSNIIAKETKLDLAEKDRNRLSTAVQLKDQELNQIKQSLSPNESNELSIVELKIRNQELENVLKNINTELRANQIRFDEQNSQLKRECSELRNKLAEERHKSQTPPENVGNDRLEKMSEQLRSADNKIIELQRELNSLKVNNNNNENNSEIIQIKNEKIRSLESNVKLLTKKYREMIQNKKEIEDKLKCIETETKSESVAKNLVSTQTDDLDEKCDHSVLITENQELSHEVERLKQEIQSKEAIIEDNQRIILNLEHERGKLWSAGENSTNKHIQSLEVMITSKREEVFELTARLAEKNQTLKEIEIKLNKKITETENDLKKERALIKDLRHSVFSEKRENSYLKKDLNELKRALSDSNAIADKRKQEVIDSQNEIQLIRKSETLLRTEIDRINGDLKLIREENTKLKAKLENSSKTSEPLLEQLKNLSLNLVEKNQEIEGLKSQFSSVRERYESEVQSLKQRIDNYESDGQQLNNELSELRKSKTHLQTRLTELRLHLKNSYEQNTKLRQQLNSYQVVVAQESTFNEELVTKLLDQSADNTKEIKPLVNLQACVESLKMEMQLLQKQISDHN